MGLRSLDPRHLLAQARSRPFRIRVARRDIPRRPGRLLLLLLGCLLVTFAAIGGVVYWMVLDSGQEGDSAALVHPVMRSDFEYYITERGDVESGGNVEIRCRVKSLGSPGVAILEIHPEGDYVQQGDLLVRFDDSLFQEQLIEQDILVSQSQAAEIQARSDLRAAEIALEEYTQGMFEQEATLIESEVFVAQENVRRSEEYLKYSRRLAARGYVTDIQLEADRFAVEKARKELAAAEKKLRVHQEFTGKKMIVQLEAEVQKMKANLEAAQSTLRFTSEKRQEIEQQIANCKIYAPQDGQVVYASETDGRGEEAIIIEEGAIIRQGQVVIVLPDPTQMRVGVRVSETKIGLIRAGNPATILLDAAGAKPVPGQIESVASFPLPKRRSYEPNEYRAVVMITQTTADLRPGLRARVRMFVDAEPNALQIPLAAVFVHGGVHYCVRKQAETWQAQPVTVGPNNDKFVVIREGLSEGDLVAINPLDYRESLKLPELDESGQVTDEELAMLP